MVSVQQRASSKSSGAVSRCLMISVVLVIILFLMPSGPSSGIQDDNLRSGQASHVSTTPTNNNNNNNNVDNNNNDDDEVQTEVENAHADIEDAEQDYLATSQKILGSAISMTGEYLKLGMTKLLGTAPDVTEEEIEDMVEAVEEQLTTETNQELTEKAEDLMQEGEQKVDEQVSEDENNEEMDIEEIRQDVVNTEDQAISTVKEGIDKKAEEMRQKMRQRAQEIEIEILEQRLSEKLGRPVKLFVGEDNEVSGIDELFSGLPNIGGSKPTNTEPKNPMKEEVGHSSGGTDGSGNPGSIPTQEADGGGGDDFDEDDDGDYRVRR